MLASYPSTRFIIETIDGENKGIWLIPHLGIQPEKVPYLTFVIQTAEYSEDDNLTSISLLKKRSDTIVTAYCDLSSNQYAYFVNQGNIWDKVDIDEWRENLPRKHVVKVSIFIQVANIHL